jgi:hypothetical protein
MIPLSLLTTVSILAGLFSYCHIARKVEERDYENATQLATINELQSLNRDLAEALQAVVDERDSEIDMMRRKYRMGTPEFDIWLEGVNATWERLEVIKAPARSALAKLPRE